MGVMTNVLVHLQEVAEAKGWRRAQRLVSVAFDSLKIRGACIYSSSSMELVGLAKRETERVVTMEWESWLKPRDRTAPEFAKDYFVFYACSIGLTNKEDHFVLPVARYATSCAQAGDISGMVTAVVGDLADYGFHTSFITSDGAAENRSFFKQVPSPPSFVRFHHALGSL